MGFGVAVRGNATGQLGSLLTYSWNGNGYAYAIGTVDRRVPILINTAAGFAPQVDTNRARNRSAKPVVDLDGNDIVNQRKLTRALWNQFKSSNCAAVLSNKDGLGAFKIEDVMQMQEKDSFFDLTRSIVANWTLDNIRPDPTYHYDLVPADQDYRIALSRFMEVKGHSSALTLNLGKPGPILLAYGLLPGNGAQYTLVHEVLIHSFKGWVDPTVSSNKLFGQNLLWSSAPGSDSISDWMSTDCRCTPGAPQGPGQPGTDPKTGKTCTAGNSKW